MFHCTLLSTCLMYVISENVNIPNTYQMPPITFKGHIVPYCVCWFERDWASTIYTQSSSEQLHIIRNAIHRRRTRVFLHYLSLILHRERGALTWDNEHVMSNTTLLWKTLRPTTGRILNTPNSVFLPASRSDSRIVIKAPILRQVCIATTCLDQFIIQSRLVRPLNSFPSSNLNDALIITSLETHVFSHRCSLFRWTV